MSILAALDQTRLDQTKSDQTRPGHLVSGTMGYPNQTRPGTIFQTKETRQFTTS